MPKRSAKRKKSAAGKSPRTKHIKIDDVHVLYPSAERGMKKQLDTLEREFGAALPRGYREFMTRLGHGWINDWLQIYCPDRQLLLDQRELLVQSFLTYSQDMSLHFHGAELTENDMRTSVQVGGNQDTMRLFACLRFPGSVFEWDGLDIRQHKSGVEFLEPFAALRMELFAYFIPLQPESVSRSLSCPRDKTTVADVVKALKSACGGRVKVIDVDEGPEPGSRTPAFWLFPDSAEVKFRVYGIDVPVHKAIHITFCCSPKHLKKVESVLKRVAKDLDVPIEEAGWW